MRGLTLYLLVKILLGWAEKLEKLDVSDEVRNDVGSLIMDIEDIAKRLEEVEY